MTRFQLSAILLFIMVLFISSQSNTVEIPLEEEGGVYMLPVRINGTVTKKFILDTGASEVSIPADVFLDMMKSGAITVDDILPGETYELADGKTAWNPRINIRKLDIGGYIVEDVPGSIDSPHSALLLGQSFLSRIPSWKLDNEDEKLIIEKTPEQIGLHQLTGKSVLDSLHRGRPPGDYSAVCSALPSFKDEAAGMPKRGNCENANL